MGEVMSLVGGPQIQRGREDAAWVVGGHGTVSISRNGASKLDVADLSRGAKPGLCYAAVVLDGAFVYSGNEQEPLFNMNTLDPATIAGIEYYPSSASIPLKYSGTRATCGLVVIWLR